jgi:hypothetical protein
MNLKAFERWLKNKKQDASFLADYKEHLRDSKARHCLPCGSFKAWAYDVYAGFEDHPATPRRNKIIE